jgi:hypothetical protein
MHKQAMEMLNIDGEVKREFAHSKPARAKSRVAVQSKLAHSKDPLEQQLVERNVSDSDRKDFRLS